MQFLTALISALVMVESGGDPAKVGDGGQALGILQIHEEVVQDVNRIYGTKYRHKDVLNPITARRICKLYLTHYSKKYSKQQPTINVLCALWNAGPRGPVKLRTNKGIQKYVQKVKREMEGYTK